MTVSLLILSGLLTLIAFASKKWLLERFIERAANSESLLRSLAVILLFPVLFVVRYGFLACFLFLSIKLAASA